MPKISLPNASLQPFPNPENVFSNSVAKHAQHLNPLVSIDLSAVDEKLQGWVHIVSPIEPCDGYLGDSGKEHWGGFLQPNWIGFKLNSDHKYELAGDFRFFGIENVDGEEPYNGAREELEEFYKIQHKSYEEHKRVFEDKGHVCRLGRREPQRVPPLSKLGGAAPIGNMTWFDPGNSSFTYSDEDAAPKTSDGRLFIFVGSTPGWSYRDAGADEILLYYDPVDRIALQSFVWG